MSSAMTSEEQRWVSVQQFLGKEGQALDEKKWDEWLALYHPDAEYWLPAWDDDGELTTDPQSEISLIYYPNRAGLEDRVFRIKSRRSSATMPLMRTCHMFTLLSVDKQKNGVCAHSSWTVQSYREGQTLAYYGWAEYALTEQDNSWLITRKKTVVLNDIANTMLDIYNV